MTSRDVVAQLFSVALDGRLSCPRISYLFMCPLRSPLILVVFPFSFTISGRKRCNLIGVWINPSTLSIYFDVVFSILATIHFIVWVKRASSAIMWELKKKDEKLVLLSELDLFMWFDQYLDINRVWRDGRKLRIDLDKVWKRERWEVWKGLWVLLGEPLPYLPQRFPRPRN